MQHETCEDRDYLCCDNMPPGEVPDDNWYDRHLAEYDKIRWLEDGVRALQDDPS